MQYDPASTYPTWFISDIFIYSTDKHTDGQTDRQLESAIMALTKPTSSKSQTYVIYPTPFGYIQTHTMQLKTRISPHAAGDQLHCNVNVDV